MSRFFAVKSMSGFNYIRLDQVLAVSSNEPTKSSIVMAGGVIVAAYEPAKDIVARIEEHLDETQPGAKET